MTSGAKFEVSPENKAIDFLTNRNVSLVLKTQAVTNHQYAEIKGDLLALYAMADSEALMLLREGHRVVGIILLGVILMLVISWQRPGFFQGETLRRDTPSFTG